MRLKKRKFVVLWGLCAQFLILCINYVEGVFTNDILLGCVLLRFGTCSVSPLFSPLYCPLQVV